MTAFLQEYKTGVSKKLIFSLINQAYVFLESQGVKSADIDPCRLALEELLMNIFHHSGLGEEDFVKVTLTFDGELLRLQVRDHGIAFDPLVAAEPDTSLSHEERPIGGLGIMLIQKMSNGFSYQREVDENVVEVSWAIDEN